MRFDMFITCVELSVSLLQESSLTGSNKSTATRIEHLAPGTVQFEVFVQENLQGQVSNKTVIW